jgi:hypothetical protein
MSSTLPIVSALSLAAASVATALLGRRRGTAAIMCCPRHGTVMAVRDGGCEPYEGDVSDRSLPVCSLRCLAQGAPSAGPGPRLDPFSF